MKVELEKKFTATSGEVSSRVTAAAGLGYDYARCYWELSKARLSKLVVATSGTRYILGSGNAAIDFLGLCYTCAGTMMIAASANSLNQIFEISIDSKMKRTTWATLLLVLLELICWLARLLQTNMLAAGLGYANLVLYVFVYTLQRTTCSMSYLSTRMEPRK